MPVGFYTDSGAVAGDRLIKIGLMVSFESWLDFGVVCKKRPCVFADEIV